MKLNNFLAGSFLSGIGLVIEFHFQSAFTKILKSYLEDLYIMISQSI